MAIAEGHHSIGTNFVAKTGSPEPWLRAIAEAGFTHVHWAHQWSGDFLYDEAEMKQFVRWLKDFGLKVNDLHASSGNEKAYGSRIEYQRLAGLELVRNRLDVAERFGCDVIVLHIPARPVDPMSQQLYWDILRRSFDALEPYARERGIRIALENLARYSQAFDPIEQLLSWYEPIYLGLCYDSGHGNIDTREGKYDFCGEGLDRIEKIPDRLIAFHLNDNDGTADQHRIPFAGTVDWSRLASIIAHSSYCKTCMSVEVLYRDGPAELRSTFLAEALAASKHFSQMVVKARAATLRPSSR